MRSGTKAMTKGALLAALAGKCELKKAACRKVVGELAIIGAKEVKGKGAFTLPGVCRTKTRVKPATKAGKKMIFGKECVVKAKPAKTVVKAFPVAALKSQI